MKVSFPVFFLLWADHKKWKIPDFHILICAWLESRDRVAVLEVFRGAAKSTIVACYVAWRLYCDPTRRFLILAADDKLAIKMSRDVRDVLRRHPLCAGMLADRSAEHMFWVNGSDDERNASVTASGILSNITGSRADEVIFDDVEVPKNIASQDLREKLRARISDATYILVPRGQMLYIGTPHAFDSIYEEKVAIGAQRLLLPLFKHNQRVENAERLPDMELTIPTEGGMTVMNGINLLHEGKDWFVEDGDLVFTRCMSGTIDVYSGGIWADRFDFEEIELRRREASSQNEWDSQYMLRAKPISEMRLDPAWIQVYHAEPTFVQRNGTLTMSLGEIRITFARCYWDVSLGKADSDDSVLTWLFEDDLGRFYWHRAAVNTGGIREQCRQVCDVVKKFLIPCVDVETNGVGGFVPAFLREALVGTGCAVREINAKGKKNDRILGAIEPVLSGRMLYAHESVAASGAFSQMREWNPATSDQPDDFLDGLAGALLSAPVRFGRRRDDPEGDAATVWRAVTIPHTLDEDEPR